MSDTLSYLSLRWDSLTVGALRIALAPLDDYCEVVLVNGPVNLAYVGEVDGNPFIQLLSVPRQKES